MFVECEAAQVTVRRYEVGEVMVVAGGQRGICGAFLAEYSAAGHKSKQHISKCTSVLPERSRLEYITV
jgi:hypothetical protein